MGGYEYAIVPFPDSPYIEDMRELLGSLFDVGVHVWGCTGEQVVQAFMMSGLAEEFERLNPVYVAGKSSYDLLNIMAPLLPGGQATGVKERLECTPDFWLGWSLGFFQVTSGVSYESVFRCVSYDELRSMYWPLHEAPESKFSQVLGEMLGERQRETRLKRLREAAGLSQSQLARASGVGLRSIQMYEQRQKDINRAQGLTLYALARALRCRMEGLLER